MSKHTPGPWEMKHYPGHGVEVYAKLEIFPAEAGRNTEHLKDRLLRFFRMPSIENISMRFNSKGELWGNIAYEDWVQFTGDEWNGMQEANARLIAAAPDLLEACKEARDTIALEFGRGPFPDPYDQLTAAITKAEGE